MILPASDQTKIAELLDGLFAAAQTARQAPDTEACKSALGRVWALNTRAYLAVQEGEESARSAALKTLTGEAA